MTWPAGPPVPLDKPTANESVLVVTRLTGQAYTFILREGEPRWMMKINYTSAGDQGIMYVYQGDTSTMFPIPSLAHWTVNDDEN